MTTSAMGLALRSSGHCAGIAGCKAGLSPLHAAAGSTQAICLRRLCTPTACQRMRTVTAATAEGDAVAESPSALGPAAALLKAAADGQAVVSKQQVFKALRDLEKARLKGGDDWYKLLAGDLTHGSWWRLIYAVGKSELEKDRKGTAEAQGNYFPLAAGQHYDSEAHELENGVFLGHMASLKFRGPHVFQQGRTVFDFWKLSLKVGPWTASFNIKKGDEDAPLDAEEKGLPFVVYFYVDEHIAAAKGRGGGWAYWRRMSASEELQRGFV